MAKRFIKQPEKEKTLARKQEEKIRKLNHLRVRLSEFSPQRWVGIGEMAGLLALFFVNFWLLLPFFGHQDQTNVFSAPVIPALASLTELLLPHSYGIRVWLLILILFFPISFYFFIKAISGRRFVGFLASFIVSLPVWIFLPLRVNLGLLSQDGGHVASLTLAPLVCLLLIRFLRQGKFWSGIFSALGIAIVALTSPIGVFVLFIFMGVITFSEMLLGRGRLKLIRFLIVFLLAIGLSAFWYNPKFALLTIQSSQGQVVKKTLSTLLPISFFLVPLLGVFGFLLFENRPQLQPMFIAFFLSVGFGLFSLGAGVAHPAPSRFLPAFGISFAFLLGILIVNLFDFLRRSPKIERFSFAPYRRLIAFVLIGLILVLIIATIAFSSRSLWELEQVQVLGLTTDQTVGIWEIKEKTDGIGNLFGYLITGLTVLGVVILKTKLGAP